MDATNVVSLFSDVIFPILGIIVLRYLVPYLKEKIGVEKLKSVTENTKNIAEAVKAGVEAAGKKFPTSGSGEIRKEYVIKYINSKGFQITELELDVLIESAVKVLDILENEIKK